MEQKIPAVVYKEPAFIVINKPAGLIVHGVSGKAAEPSVVSWLLVHYPEVAGVGDDPEHRPGIVHRLDRDTSGVMIIPRTQESFLFFKKLFQAKEIQKTYITLVYGRPAEPKGTIDKPIGLNSGTVKRTVHTKRAKMVKDAVTDYEVVRSFAIGGASVSLVRVQPKTGRTHQIRVHLASLNCPIVGDTLYGPKKQLIAISRQFLHAEAIEFPTPRGNRLLIRADIPEDLAMLLK
jgi:23S rRNA pseudouridine1911/1915/1917 synthase